MLCLGLATFRLCSKARSGRVAGSLVLLQQPHSREQARCVKACRQNMEDSNLPGNIDLRLQLLLIPDLLLVEPVNPSFSMLARCIETLSRCSRRLSFELRAHELQLQSETHQALSDPLQVLVGAWAAQNLQGLQARMQQAVLMNIIKVTTNDHTVWSLPLHAI
eukprot:1151628-Pelagomonas_calceolata.AAC.3